jgi:hypothetical protein
MVHFPQVPAAFWKKEDVNCYNLYLYEVKVKVTLVQALRLCTGTEALYRY